MMDPAQAARAYQRALDILLTIPPGTANEEEINRLVRLCVERRTALQASIVPPPTATALVATSGPTAPSQQATVVLGQLAREVGTGVVAAATTAAALDKEYHLTDQAARAIATGGQVALDTLHAAKKIDDQLQIHQAIGSAAKTVATATVQAARGAVEIARQHNLAQHVGEAAVAVGQVAVQAGRGIAKGVEKAVAFEQQHHAIQTAANMGVSAVVGGAKLVGAAASGAARLLRGVASTSATITISTPTIAVSVPLATSTSSNPPAPEKRD
eukprot:GAFH01003336.1.p1 GENE.GAFH01003336.1~~GAFH01003336.1.p1  ORF type:complete len:295 (-),score=11.61 GAFH01003336.1:73-885(-)